MKEQKHPLQIIFLKKYIDCVFTEKIKNWMSFGNRVEKSFIITLPECSYKPNF